MNNTNALEKAIALLQDQTKRILDLEQLAEPSEHSAALLRAFGRVARAVAVQKGIATAGSDKVSDIVRLLTFPSTVTALKNGNVEVAQKRRESDEKSVKALKAIAQKGSAFDPKIYEDLAAVLREIARVRGVPIEAGATPVEIFERIRPFLVMQGLKLKPTLP